MFSKQDHFNEEQAFPLNKEGETLFMNLKPGDVANRILSVGDTGRALKISKFFDKPEYNILVRFLIVKNKWNRRSYDCFICIQIKSQTNHYV